MIYAMISINDLIEFEIVMNSTTNVTYYRLLKIIHLSSQQNKTVPELAELFDFHQATIRKYIHNYSEHGLAGLKRNKGSGCTTGLTLTKAQWEELLQRSPSQFDKLNTAARNWTQSFLVTYCAQYLGVKTTQQALSALFKRLKIKWNRGKLKVTSPDPLYTAKRERIDTLKKSTGTNLDKS